MKSDERQEGDDKQQKEEDPRRMLFKSDAKTVQVAPQLGKVCTSGCWSVA
jgi:hypothetical protein